MARNVFKGEIAERFSSGEKTVILFLLEGNYLEYLDESEKRVLIVPGAVYKKLLPVQ